ncbi:MAG TPA: hypothetical protein VFO78_03435 [Candidatus Limnocylindrales bacterium]|nr:hypothetical protein [Candidatus Limnocylindrales bacterium]
MTKKKAMRGIRREREIPPAKDGPGMRSTDDHVAGTTPRGASQPTSSLEGSASREHLSSPSQGVRPVEGRPTDGRPTDRHATDRHPAGADEFAGGGIATGSSDLVDDEAAGGGPSGDEDAGSGPAFEPDER